MSQEKIYPKGIVCFDKHAKAPDFVVGSIVITLNDLIEWLKANQNLLTDYNGKKQLKLQLLKGSKGLYMTVDTYKAQQVNSTVSNDLQSDSYDDTLPF